MNPIERREVFNASHPDFKPLDSSLLRKIKEVFFKIVCNGWRSLASSFYTIPINKETESKLEALCKEGKINPRAPAQLLKKGCIGSESMQAVWDQVLAPEYRKKAEFIPLSYDDTGLILPDVDINKRYLLLPIVVKGRFRNHVIAVFFDRVLNRIEFYDPKGLTSQDRASEHVVCRKKQEPILRDVEDIDEFTEFDSLETEGSPVYEEEAGLSITLSEVLMQIVEKYGDSETSIWENTYKNQRDSHNCGMFTIDFFERRLAGEWPEVIVKNGRHFSEVNHSLRLKYIIRLSNS